MESVCSYLSRAEIHLLDYRPFLVYLLPPLREIVDSYTYDSHEFENKIFYYCFEWCFRQLGESFIQRRCLERDLFWYPNNNLVTEIRNHPGDHILRWVNYNLQYSSCLETLLAVPALLTHPPRRIPTLCIRPRCYGQNQCICKEPLTWRWFSSCQETLKRLGSGWRATFLVSRMLVV